MQPHPLHFFLNLPAIPDLGAPVASIGGAGTFDGIFLVGVIAPC